MDYAWPASEKMDLTTHAVQLRSCLLSEAARQTVGPDPRSPSCIVRNSGYFDSSDLPGAYTIRVTITDHVHSVYAKAEEKFQLIQ